ncbi:sensor domain-containing protein [Streptomyces violaceoruber]|uniref:sensor histidine kinase n=1 Tax=Streptomyces violaceoruber TaxID=1935 RepID=UPI001F47B9A2|nr:sensor domain-containing protein [Streptomyces violaceoruber]MCF3167102.1 sensor domain-containing protein [Streptomyces violaceoruber]
MHTPGLWQALHERRYLRSGWPWRCALYFLTSAPLGAAVLVCLLVLALAGSLLTVVLVGVPLLLMLVLAGLPVARLERRRLRLIDPAVPMADAHRDPPRTGPAAWLRTRLQERSTWRELGYALLFACLLWPLEAVIIGTVIGVSGGLVSTPLVMATAGGGEEVRVIKLWLVHSYPAAFAVALAGLLLLPLLAYPLGLLAAGRARLTRLLLDAPPEQDDVRVRELSRSRMRLVTAFEAERRRIERDLHDGAQQRLVALSMHLGLARLDAREEPLAGLLAQAHGEAQAALVELRELIRGIHPRVLTDRGLAAAVEDIADRSPVPVDLDLDLPHRFLEAVESAVYFAVCEALANVAKHSRATRAAVEARVEGGRLDVRVRDNGVGGADKAGGTGLEGVADRLAVLGGRLLVSSPSGGPTVLRVLVPCPPAPDHRLDARPVR